MFRIEVFVDDKKLSGFLHACAGLVTSMSPPVPVVNIAKEEELEAASNGSIPDMFYNELKKKKMQEFTPKEAHDILDALGGFSHSYNYVCKLLKQNKQAKLLRRGKWRVL
jgi:hypothetical protein